MARKIDYDKKNELWKNRLLDLSKRNKMLCYRDTKRAGLRITAPSMSKLWSSLVLHEGKLTFPLPDIQADQLDESGARRAAAPAKDDVVCNQTPDERQKTLKSLRGKAKSFQEEQGVNALYLGFGLLHWKEASARSKVLTAPLVLVPVSLECESLTKPFALSVADEEPVVNPTLAFLLQQDYGIELPACDFGKSVSPYLASVQEAVSCLGWQVEDGVILSLFSFQKIKMHDDIERHREEIVAHPIIRAICGDEKAVAEAPVEMLGSHVSTAFQIVDADSSQQEAIARADAGESFILQGPPGTGKSQTITNIIASAMANGKRVLFVSEKRAALDVVHRRLERAGLGDFLFVLHDPKANKREIVAQLENVLSYVNKAAKLNARDVRRADKIGDCESELDAYVREVSKQLDPLQESAYEAYCKLIALSQAPTFGFSLEGVGSVDQDRLDELLAALDAYAIAANALPTIPSENPWRGLKAAHVSNAYCERVGSALHSCADDADLLVGRISDALSALGIDATCSRTVAQLRELTDAMDTASHAPSLDQGLLGLDPAEVATAVEEVCSLRKRVGDRALQGIHEAIGRVLAAFPGFSCDADVLDDAQATAALTGVRALVEQDPCMSAWDSRSDRDKVEQHCDDLIVHVSAARNERAWILERFEPGALDLDERRLMLYRHENEYRGIFKVFKSEYKSDRQQISCLQRRTTKPIEDADALELLRHVAAYRSAMEELDSKTGLWSEVFPSFWKGIETDIDALKHAASSFTAVRDAEKMLLERVELLDGAHAAFNTLQTALGTSYKGLYADETALAAVSDWYVRYREQCHVLPDDDASRLDAVLCREDSASQISDARDEIARGIEGFASIEGRLCELFEPGAFDDMGIATAAARMCELSADESGLRLWTDYLEASDRCRAEGLGSYIELLAEGTYGREEVRGAFLKRFYTIWLDWACEQLPEVDAFRGANRDKAIDVFAEEDRFGIEFAQKRVKSAIISSLSNMGAGGEIAILRRETAKRRKITPTRILFGMIPHLVMALKPCMMMSPLSVSMFLESPAFEFDLVVFDEASQVCTENAIGSILRGKQAVICGDSRQLPPTSFFSAAMSNADDFDGEDDETFDEEGAFDSVLEEASMLPTQMLRWHYRSRNESLISFSNKEIYDGKLVTFPSAGERSAEHGVEFEYVSNGVYERGKGNAIEAERTAGLVFEQAERHPERTLGVIAFGERQRQMVEDAVVRRRLETPEREDFFSEDKDESFFIKSLENVQGDERDTIILSVGYGKDATGRMRMNFGPINQAGGERRLNVAVTRAKINLKLVSSIRAHDIDTARASGLGPQLLQDYLRYAEMRSNAIRSLTVGEEDGLSPDAAREAMPLDDAVRSCLEAAGYKTQLHVGSSSNQVDVAVIDPKRPDGYLFGVLCDGKSYRAVASARDRDRLRPDILRVNGWKITYAWAPDWARDRAEAERRLLAFAEKVAADGEDVEGVGKHEADLEPIPSPKQKRAPKGKRAGAADLKIVDVEQTGFNEYGFQVYREYEKGVQSSSISLWEYLADVVEHESPIATELLMKRAATKLGLKRVTDKVRDSVKSYLSISKGTSRIRNGIVYALEGQVTARTKGSRTVAQIAPEEYDEGLLTVARVAFSISEEDLVRETAKAFGFSKASAVVELLEKGIRRLRRRKSLVLSADKKLMVPDGE